MCVCETSEGWSCDPQEVLFMSQGGAARVWLRFWLFLRTFKGGPVASSRSKLWLEAPESAQRFGKEVWLWKGGVAGEWYSPL